LSYNNWKSEIKTCNRCGVVLTDENWWASQRKRQWCVCKNCLHNQSKNNLIKKYGKPFNPNYIKENRERIKKNSKEYKIKLKKEVINSYGGKCNCCGISDIKYLTVEHINGGGNKHKEKVGRGSSFYMWLKKNGYPPEFTVLCYNCNCGKNFRKTCPHHEDEFMNEVMSEKITPHQKSVYKYVTNMKKEVFNKYGNVCKICGEFNYYFLTIDHINNDGNLERKKVNYLEFYKKLRDTQPDISKYQILCFNCNCGKRFVDNE